MDKKLIVQALNPIWPALASMLMICVSVSLLGSLLGYSHLLYGAEKKHQSVQDPRYGVALWHYFQDQNFQALTELMMAEDRSTGRAPIQGHGDNPKVMKAALELAYGMVEQSRTAFEKIADESLSPSIKSSAWYYLAKIYYQRGDLHRAESALNILDSLEKTSNIASNALSLKLDVLIRKGDLSGAEQLITTAEASFADKSRVFFNLGNAHSRNLDYDRALVFFDQSLEAVKAQKNISEADIQLADKTYVSAGYSALLSGKPQKAISYFSRIQQQAIDSGLGLLGYGRAATELEHYQQALAFFGVLSKQDSCKAGVYESLISVPVIYERIQQPARALRAYEHAIATYQREIAEIDTEITQLREQHPGSLFVELSDDNGSRHWLNDPGIYAVTSSAPNSNFKPNSIFGLVTKNPGHHRFSELFSESEFQTELLELQDLIALGKLASARLERLSMLKQSLINRQQDRQRYWLQYGALQAEQKLQAYRQRLEQMIGLLQTSVDNKDYLALIPDGRKALLERIEQSEQRIAAYEVSNHEEAGQARPNIAKQKNLLRVYRGMLFWQAAQDYAEEKYALETSISELEMELDHLTSHQLRVAAILDESALPATQGSLAQTDSEEVYLARIEGLEKHAQLINRNLDQKIAEVKTRVFGSMVALLEERQEKLHQYLTHARLASLRIHEEGSLALNIQSSNLGAVLGADSGTGTHRGVSP